MQQLLEIFSSQGWSNFVWSLVHSLWIGALCALALSMALRATPANQPARRYNCGLAALGGVVLGTLIAWGALDVRSDRSSVGIQAVPPVSVEAGDAFRAPIFEQTPANATPPPTVQPTQSPGWVPWAATAWLLGLSLMVIRLASQMVDVKRVRKSCVELREGPACEMALELAEKLRLKRVVRVATSALTSVPAALGIMSPTILLPLSMATGLPPEQLRAILAHELAHIRRHDYAVNLLQQLVEALLFFNPAVWWINKQVRNEREASCDLIAVELLDGKENYAQALTDWLAAGHGSRAHLQPAFPGDNKPETLVERMRRLLLPNYRPALRVPWHSFVGVMLVTTVCLFTAWQGSHLAVAIAADLLSPKERIEKIAALQESHGGALPMETEEEIIVGGTIRTHDGKPLPEPLHMHMSVKTHHTSYGIGGVEVKDGRFQRKVKRGRIYISAGAGGYGTAFLGPIEAPQGQSLTNIEVVLPKGYAAKMRVLDPDGQPVAGARLNGSYQHPAGYNALKLVTDEAGEAILSGAVAEQMRWEVSAPGFQAAKFEGRPLEAEAPTIWRLSPAKPAAGRVVERGSGKPVAGAVIKLIARHPEPSLQTMPEHAEVIARSDAAGRFTLEQLVDGASHVLIVESEGSAPKVVHKVLAGQRDLTIELGPEIILSGTITGHLEQLKSWDGSPVVSVVNPLKLRDDSENRYSVRVPVTIEQGVARFRVANLREGKVILQAGTQTHEYELTESLTNVSISLASNEPFKEVAKREVIIRFITPEGLPQVSGTLGYNVGRVASSEDHRSQPVNGTQKYFVGSVAATNEGQLKPTVNYVTYDISGFSGVTNNEVRITVPVPSHLSYGMSRLLGYWAPSDHAPVTAGREPLVLEVRPLPAGAIYGHVRNHDGTELSGVMISVIEADPAPERTSVSSLGQVGKNTASGDDAPTKFIAQPLPLGGKYRLVAHSRSRFAVSDLIHLTEKQPIQEVEMRFAAGVTLPIKVVDQDGNPLQGIRVDLSYTPGDHHSFGVSGSLSDINGELKIDEINPDARGHYEAVVGGAFNGRTTPHFQPLRREIDFRHLPVVLELKRGRAIRRTVLNDATGNPLSGAVFDVMPVDRQADGGAYIQSDEKSSPDGAFEFTTLRPIEYWLGCGDGQIVGGDGNNMGRVRVRGGQKEAVTIRIIPHKGVRLMENGRPVFP